MIDWTVIFCKQIAKNFETKEAKGICIFKGCNNAILDGCCCHHCLACYRCGSPVEWSHDAYCPPCDDLYDKVLGDEKLQALLMKPEKGEK